MLLAILALSISAAFAQTADERFDRLMRDILIVDTHIDTPRYVVDEGYKLAEEHDYYEFDIPRMKRGRLGAVFFGIYTSTLPRSQWIPWALKCIDAVHEEVRANSNDLEMAYTADDILRIRREGRAAALLSLEGGHMILDSLRILRAFYRMGVRYITLTHFQTNNWADSSTDVAVHDGLSELGRDVVREMNRIGMMIDISHVSDKTFCDVVETTRAPVIASHSSAAALCDNPRNMSDDLLRALKRNGGVAFVNINVPYLDPRAYEIFIGYRDDRNREIAEMMQLQSGNPRRFEMRRAIQARYRARLPKVDIKDVLRHIDHIAKVAGPDHVGIGSDFDGVSGMVPAGFEDVSKYPAIVRGLIEMGYSDQDIRKIMGENLIRVMRANEAVAER